MRRVTDHLATNAELILPDASKTFVLEVDFSDTGLGGVLLQSRNGRLLPVGCASRLLKAGERDISLTEGILRASAYCLGKFKDLV